MGEAKVLLVGSSFSAAPLYFALKKYGFHVSVCGNIETDPCHQYADTSYFLDYSQPENLIEVVESGEFDFLVPSCNDYSYMSCARIASNFKFPGFDEFEVAKTLHTKNAFRAITADLGLPAPGFVELREGQTVDSGLLHYPIMVKPIDSFSGRGMSKVAIPNLLSKAVHDARQASRSGNVVLEEFIDGSLHSHSAWLQEGCVALDFFVDEFCTVYPYQVNCSNHPSSLPLEIRNNVRSSINRIASKMNLADGLIHTQFMVSGNDLWIIETMRRCPGDLYGTLVARSTGIDYADLFVRPFLGKGLPEQLPEIESQPYGRHTVSVDQSLVYFSFSNSIPAEQVDIVPLKGSGEMLHPAPFDKLGVLFAKFRDRETMLSTTPRLAEFVAINQPGVNE